MKRTTAFTAVLLLALASISAKAQTPPATTATPAAPQTTPTVKAAVPQSKIAVVNTEFFRDEKTGIKRYVNAARSLEREFQPATAELTTLQTRITALVDELTKLPDPTGTAYRAKLDETQRLQGELKTKQDKGQADYAKRYEVVVGPISAAIGKALDQYATKHGLTMILDISKLGPAILTINAGMDVTDAFIADFNTQNP